MTQWLIENGFNLFGALGIIGSLLFTAVSLRSETKTRRIANLLTITGNYREIWKAFLNTPALRRVIDPSADVKKHPVAPVEELFVGLIISHLNTVFYATNDALVVEWEGLRRDVKSFFSLPVPRAVWSKTKLLQNQDFAAFIDTSLN